PCCKEPVVQRLRGNPGSIGIIRVLVCQGEKNLLLSLHRPVLSVALGTMHSCPGWFASRILE
ncbi:MAG TPA: hypothetical protein PKW51_07050, partial [Methanoregulaceae archaeon]|nr:hypothetical protein [Methanoregulaceae archaeon]